MAEKLNTFVLTIVLAPVLGIPVMGAPAAVIQASCWLGKIQRGIR
jgi:hypothetical protein